MKLLPLVILILVVSALLSGCGSGKYDERLLKAEELMDNRPDSSLHILDSLNPVALRQERDKALYALLLTMARDKNHLDPGNDSLISTAVDYFSQNKDEERLARAYHYRGRIHQLKTNYSDALLDFYRAKIAALNTDQYLIAGLACRGMSDIYFHTNNQADEVTFAEQEYEYTLKSGRQPYINYAMADLLRALTKRGLDLSEDNDDRVFPLASQLADSAKEAGDIRLLHNALRTKARFLSGKHRFHEADSIIRYEMSNIYLDSFDTIMLAYVATMMGKSDMALDLLNKRDQNQNTMQAHQVKSLIYKHMGRYAEAQYERDITDSMSVSFWGTATVLPLNSELSNWFDLSHQLNNEKIKLSEMRLWLSIGLSCGVFLIILLLFIRYRLRKQRMMNQKVAWIMELRDELERKDLEIEKRESELESKDSELERKDNELDRKNNELELKHRELARKLKDKQKTDQLIKDLMNSHYSVIESIADINVKYSETGMSDKKILRWVDRLMSDMSERSPLIVEMEKKVDEIYDHLYTDFKNDLPDLKENDYKLFLFSIYGFSAPVMALFLKEKNVEAVYNRRQRLRRKIRSLSPEKAERYLKYC